MLDRDAIGESFGPADAGRNACDDESVQHGKGNLT